MGVHGLWELLAPVGRRVSVETLAGKKLAIDASIWMIQFMKAMRDEKGEMVRNAHILGFFRRICKLLFLRTKPVFVFDGGTPALKRRTVIARRRQRENAQAKIRKTAEKLLLNHLKATRLKELAKDLENQRQMNEFKGKRIITDKSPVAENNTEGAENVLGSYNQEALDEMLAASLAAEEDQSFTGDASTSGAGTLHEDDDEDEEIILPTMHGKVDPAVLASLPPSMQLDLLVQMRERLMAENRQKYQKVKKAPARFSELQIQAYLKTVAFRREIGEVQKTAAGRGIGGMQTSRIASEANREFIFSSSFTGDKQALTSAGLERKSNEENQAPISRPSSVSLGEFASTNKSNAVVDEPNEGFNDDVETYLDERGRVRVSRHRAMGLRMTRDLQRNLDLMKESEVILEKNENVTNNPTVEESTSRNKSSIEVSFEAVDEEKYSDSDDDLFARLVTGDSVLSNAPSKKDSSDPSSDCEWEDGSVPKKDNLITHDINDEGEVECEEESFEIPQYASQCLPESSKPISIGAQVEEFEFQEAVRRSLEDLTYQKDTDKSLKDVNLVEERETVNEAASFGSTHQEKVKAEPKSPSQNVLETNSSSNITKISESLGTESAASVPVNAEISSEGRTGIMFVERNIKNVEPVTLTEEIVVDLLKENPLDPTEVNEEFEFETASDYNLTKRDEPAESFEKESAVQDNLVQIAPEEKYEEDANDYCTLMDSRKEQVEYTEASLEDEMVILDKERTDLNDEQRKLERNAESVSGEMFAECQELLQMFGLPYIIAPMEAEAQCAYMELINLVDGVVTDDSDVFLFGARSVYKNIFDDRKYVETYFMKDIENELGITREKLIRMAMLLGSDYTEGVSGIGIVNAVEVVNAFPEEDGLQKFREWIESPDPSILGKADLQAGSRSKKKGSNSNIEGASLLDDIDKVKQIFMDKHRNVSKNWHIPSTFPSEAVISAYTAPQVDRSTEPFSWGKPDQGVLRKLCWEKFGWGTQKADELLVPVLKEYNKHETQLRLEAFYTFNERFAKIRSKRIKKAVKGIAGNKSSELMDDSVEEDSQSRKKAKQTQNSSGPEMPSTTTKSGRGGEKNSSKEKSASKPLRKKRNLIQVRGKSVGKGKRKWNSDFGNSETSSGEGNGSDSEQEVQVEKHDVPHEVRRSTRSRKPAKYTSNDMEIDESNITVQDGTFSNKDPIWDESIVGDDAALSRSETNHHKVIDPSHSVAEPEIRTGEMGSGQNGDPFPEAELSQDYLKIGGGFCLEEDDEDKELAKFESKKTLNFSVNVEESEHGVEQNLDRPNVTADGNLSNVDISEKNMEENGCGTRSQSSLKAMPFLSRKRRKS